MGNVPNRPVRNVAIRVATEILAADVSPAGNVAVVAPAVETVAGASPVAIATPMRIASPAGPVAAMVAAATPVVARRLTGTKPSPSLN